MDWWIKIAISVTSSENKHSSYTFSKLVATWTNQIQTCKIKIEPGKAKDS